MEINEVKEKKVELENKIKDLVNEFQDETGLLVSSLNLQCSNSLGVSPTSIYRVMAFVLVE